MKLVVVSASLSENSSTDQLGRKLAESAQAELKEQGVEATIEMVQLRVLARAIADAFVTGFPNPALEEAFDKVAGADGVIAVTPAYNASYSGLFKSFFDVLPEDTLKGKPMAIGATGGTPRHSLVTEHALRPLFVYLHAIVAPTAVYAATEDWGAHAGDSDGRAGLDLSPRTRRTGRELASLLMFEAGMAAGHSSVESADEAVFETQAAPAATGSAAAHVGPSSASLGRKSKDELLDMDPGDLFADFTSFENLLK